MTPDLAFTIALGAGWTALVVAFAWPTPHCRCCSDRRSEGEAPDRVRR